MAETAASFALPKLVAVFKMLRGLQTEVEDIKAELQIFQYLINHKAAEAEKDKDGGELIKTCVKQLREATYRMEDIIDDYDISEDKQSGDAGCAALPCEAVEYFKTLFFRIQIAYKIQDVKSLVQKLRERYGLQTRLPSEPGLSTSGGNQNVLSLNLRMAALYAAEADVVGFEGPRDLLKDWLMKGQAKRTVISIVGMGGLGKTTLAKKVFNNTDILGHFDCHAWITVSQSYTEEGLLRDMLDMLCNEKVDDATNVATMIDKLRKGLCNKRYVVVFDDVWDTNFWEVLQFALIDNENGSRILMTTRYREVAEFCEQTSVIQVHMLEPLSHENSFELLCKKAFRYGFDGSCPKEYKHVGLEIVRKCEYLPLAIVAIGSLLKSKYKSPSEWKEFSQKISLEMERNSQLDGISKILSLSYDDLPYHLRPCLLYFGMFPEDYEVKSNRLIRQWIAEGFVKPNKSETLEEIAQQYLMELINKSLVQIASFSIDGNPKKCRVHDLIHDLILRKIKDTGFCQHIGGHDQSVSCGIVRRLTIAATSNDLIGNIERSQLRSIIIFFREGELSGYYIFKNFLAKYMPLKVLDFQDITLFSHVPENLGNLIHLKYLSFRNTYIESLPKSIGKLCNLESLDIRGTNVHVISKEINKFRKLRHLLGDNIFGFRLEGMTSLQTLHTLDIGCDDAVLGDLEELEQLRNLGLFYIRGKPGKTLCPSLKNMRFLEKLYILTDNFKHEVIDLNHTSPPSTLRKLYLRGRLDNLPNWIPRFENLVKLTFLSSGLTSDPLKLLKGMSNLLLLSIHAAYQGESLHFESGGFQKLKKVQLRFLNSLKAIIIDSGTLHSLEKLELVGLSNLKMVPSGIQHLEKLEVVNIYDMPDNIRNSVYAYGEQKSWTIQEKLGF